MLVVVASHEYSIPSPPNHQKLYFSLSEIGNSPFVLLIRDKLIGILVSIQEAVGYFFCLEDRALLCRKCDVAIHTSNTHMSAHRRFLLTGVKVGLESGEPGGSSSSGKSPPGKKISVRESSFLPTNGTPMSSATQYNKVLPGPVGGAGNFAPTKLPMSGGSAAGSIPQWHFDEYFGLSEFNQTYGYMDIGSSKVYY